MGVSVVPKRGISKERADRLTLNADVPPGPIKLHRGFDNEELYIFSTSIESIEPNNGGFLEVVAAVVRTHTGQEHCVRESVAQIAKAAWGIE